MKRNKTRRAGRGRLTLLIGVVMIGALALAALFAPLICRFDPLEQNLYDFLKAPGGEHPFGTDQLGRDMFARVL